MGVALAAIGARAWLHDVMCLVATALACAETLGRARIGHMGTIYRPRRTEETLRVAK